MTAGRQEFGLTIFSKEVYTPDASHFFVGMDAMSHSPVCTTPRPPSSATRRNDPNVDRWVAMLSAELESEDKSPPSHPSANRFDESPTDALTTVSLEFGSRRCQESDSCLTPGSTLQLDSLADDPVDLVVGGHTIARGELIVVEGKIGVRIVELLVCLIAVILAASPNAFGNDRPKQSSSSRQIELFDREPTEVLETPFGTTRGRRSAQPTTDIEPNESKWADLSDAEQSRHRESEPRDKFDQPSIPLTKPSASRRRSLDRNSSAAGSSTNATSPGWGTSFWALLGVLALIGFGARWLKSQASPAARGLPEEAWEILGRTAVDARSSVWLVRCGSRLLLLNASPAGLRTLTEITDPVEIDCLAGLCRTGEREQGLADTFRAMLTRPMARKSISDFRPASEPARMPEWNRSSNVPGLADRVSAHAVTSSPSEARS